MDDLKTLQKKISDLNTEQHKIDDIILIKLYDILFDILNEMGCDYDNIDDVKKQYIINQNFKNNEFHFRYPFGNISFKKLNDINSGFHKYDFIISSVIALDDTYEDLNGLEISFKGCEDDN